MENIGLVLEGGGMRGAYTAGALVWLIEQNIIFNYGVGISSGAMHLCSYYKKDSKMLEDISCKYMSDKRNVGIIPLLKEFRYVGYDYMFDHLLKDVLHYDVSALRESNEHEIEFGVFDCEQGDTYFFDQKILDDDLRFLKAACTLPIAGRIVDFNGHKYLDGGIKIMIPIERSIKKGCKKHFVITTKPEGYVRKAAGKPMLEFMRLNYLKYPKVFQNYRVRANNYNKQMEIIYDLVAKGDAMLIRPSETIPVKRFSGDPENLKKLYELGYADMENRKEEIFAFIERPTMKNQQEIDKKTGHY